MQSYDYDSVDYAITSTVAYGVHGIIFQWKRYFLNGLMLT